MIQGLIISIILLVSITGRAQDAWDVQRCIQYAWENSILMQQAKYGVDFEEVNLKQNQQSRYPNLNASTNVNLLFGRSLDITTDAFTTQSILTSNYNLSTGVLLWNAGRINKNIEQSNLNLDAAALDVEQVKRDIALGVGTAYLNALFAQENLGIFQNSLQLTKEQLTQIDKLIDAGARPRNDRLDIVAQLSNDEQQIVTSENNLAIAMLNLKQLMNLDVENEIRLVAPPESIFIETDPDQLEFSELYEQAKLYQANIKAGESRLKSAELGVEIANSGKYPSIFANGSIGTSHSNKAQGVQSFENQEISSNVIIDNTPSVIIANQSVPIFSDTKYFDQLDENLGYGFGVGANIPIYDNYNTKANVQRAKINVLNTQAQNEQLYQTLRTNVQQALSDARGAKRALQASENTMNARKAAFENAEKRFNLGAINTFEYVNIKNQYESSKINYVISKYDYLFRSKIIDFYMGKTITLD